MTENSSGLNKIKKQRVLCSKSWKIKVKDSKINIFSELGLKKEELF